MQETQSEASLDREPLADSVRYCECLHSGGLHDECVYSCMVAAGVPNEDLPSWSRDGFILYMKGFSGSKIRAALWLSWPPSRSARLCSVISFHVALSCFLSALVIKLALQKPDKGHKMKQKHQNEQQDSWRFQ